MKSFFYNHDDELCSKINLLNCWYVLYKAHYRHRLFILLPAGILSCMNDQITIFCGWPTDPSQCCTRLHTFHNIIIHGQMTSLMTLTYPQLCYLAPWIVLRCRVGSHTYLPCRSANLIWWSSMELPCIAGLQWFCNAAYLDAITT